MHNQSQCDSDMSTVFRLVWIAVHCLQVIRKLSVYLLLAAWQFCRQISCECITEWFIYAYFVWIVSLLVGDYSIVVWSKRIRYRFIEELCTLRSEATRYTKLLKLTVSVCSLV